MNTSTSTRRSARPLAFAAALAVLLPATLATAAPVVDDQVGVLVDAFDDRLGLLDTSSGTFGVHHDGPSRSLTLTDPAQPGQVVTVTYTPASVRAWGRVLIQADVADPADLTVALVDPAADCATASCDERVVELLALEPATEPGWTFEAAIPTSYDPAAFDALRLRLRLAATNPALPPIIARVGVTWDPLSVISLDLGAAATVCSNRAITYTVPTAVSRVGAERLVVALRAPTAEALPPFLASPSLTLASASHGGTLHTGPATTIGGLPVSPGDVVWDINPATSPVAPGTTFVLTASFNVPQGLADGATFRASASARAANADPATSPDAVTAVTATPAPRVRLGYGGVYRIFNQDWAEPGSDLTGRVTVDNPYRPSCGQTYHRAVVTHDLSAFAAYAPSAIAAGPSAISDGGVYVPAGATQTFYDADAAPVAVTGPAIAWTLDALPVGATRTLTWAFTLADLDPLASGDSLDTAAAVRSAWDTETAAATHTLRVDVPSTPSGVFALGNTVGTATEIAAGRDDLPHVVLTYGDTVGFPMRAANTGASRLLGVWMFQRVAPGTELVSASAPAGTTLHFSTDPAGATANPATPFDATWNAATGTWDLGASWSTTAPAPGVATWVAARVDALASPYFPEPGVPTAVTVAVTTRTLPASSNCAEATLTAYLVHDIEGYLGLGDATPTAVPGAGTTSDANPDLGAPLHAKVDREHVVVDDVLPGFDRSRLDATRVRDGSGAVDYTFTLTNDSGATRTDFAAPVELVIDFPSAIINGAHRHLPLVAFDVAGGVVTDLSPAGDAMTVRWDVFPPHATETVTLGFLWPRGGVHGATATLNATVTGDDDHCGTVATDLSATTTYTGSPALRLSKSADLAAVGVGDEITYRLRALNYADTVSEGTVVFDRVPDHTTFVRGLPLAAGAFWFSSAAPPLLPDRLDDPLAVTADLLDSGLFSRGVEQPDGTWTSSVPNPTWVAVALDSGSPPHLGAGVERDARFVVTVDATAPGTLIANRGLVDADVVLGAVSNTARTIVTDEPHLTVARACADVAAAEETFTYHLSLYNSSSADDDTVTLSETLPPGVTFISSTVTWNDAASAYAHVPVPPTVDGAGLTWDLTAALADDAGAPTPLGPLEGATVAVTVTADAALASGTVLTFTGVAVATNAAAPDGAAFYGACATRVSNADLAVRAFVDRARPIAGDAVLLTVLVANEDLRFAADVGLTVALPPELTLAGAVTAANPAYTFVGADGVTVDVQPVVTGDTLAWTFPSRQLIGPSGVPGRLEGDSGDLILRLPLLVSGAVGQDVPLAITATATTTTGQGDDLAPDTATVALRTPRPDLYVAADAVATALPGDAVDVLIGHGNLSRQPADPSAVVTSLPQNPAAPADPAATFLAAVAPTGATTYVSDAPLDQPAPPFNGPGSPGWATSPSSLLGPVAWVAWDLGPVDGLATADELLVQLALTDPTSGLQAPAGATFTTCATIGQLSAQVGGQPDDDPSNDSACATTAIPGVNIAAEILCDPDGATPGVVAGQPVSAQLVLINRGTTAAYGLSLTHDLGGAFTVDAVDAEIADLRGPGDQATTPLDASGAPIRDAVPITVQAGGTYVIGTVGAPGDPLHYRNVGLRPGDRVVIPVQLTANPAAADTSTLTTTLSVATAYQLGWIEGVSAAEELLADNVDACHITARRADVTVQIDAVDAEARSAGDRITWRVTYDNAGSAPAADVVYTSMLEAGQSFVVGSLTGTPSGFDVSYAGPTGWGYTPTGAAGATDPAVRGLRLSGDELPSPVGGGYALRGDAMIAEGGRVAVGGDGRLAATDDNLATFTTPVIPGDGRAVLDWRTIELGAYTASGSDGVSVAVLDATTGEVVPGFDTLVADAQGRLDLSTLPTAVQAIQLRVSLTGVSAACDYLSPSTISLATPLVQSETSFITKGAWSGNARGDVVVGRYDADTGIYRTGFFARLDDGTHELQIDDALTGSASNLNFNHPVHVADDVALLFGNSPAQFRLYRRDAAAQRWRFTQASRNGIFPLHYSGESTGTAVHTATGRLLHLLRSGDTVATILVEASDPAGTLTDLPLDLPAGVTRLGSSSSGGLVAPTGRVLTHARTGARNHFVVWEPAADLSTFVAHEPAMPEGFTVNLVGSNLVGVLPDSSFVVSLFVPGSPTVQRGHLLRFDAAGGHSWVELTPPAPHAPGASVTPRFVTDDGRVVAQVGGTGDPWVAFIPQPDGTVVSHDFGVLPNGQRPYFNTTSRQGDISGPSGDLYFLYYTPSPTRVGVYRPTPTGYDLELMPTISQGGSLTSEITGFTGDGAPVAKLTGHGGGYSAVTWTPDGAGGWTEVLLGRPGFNVNPYAPGPGGTIVGDTNEADGRLTTWDVSGGASPDPGEPAPPYRRYEGRIIRAGGSWVVGSYSTSSGFTFPIIWGPGVGTDPTGDGWGYVQLPLPTGAISGEPVYVSANGFAVGNASEVVGGPSVAVGWRPLGGGAWAVESLDYRGSAALNLDAYSAWNPYRGDPLNVRVTIPDTGWPGQLVADPTAPGGFQVLVLESAGAQVFAVSQADRLIGGVSGDGQPVIAFVDAAGALQNLTLPHGGDGGEVVDLFEGAAAGLVHHDGAPSVATVWRRDASGDWTEHSLGATTTTIATVAVRLAAGGHALVTPSADEISFHRFDDGAFTEVPLTLGDGDATRAYYFNGSIYGPGPSSYPFTLQHPRDGLILARVTSDLGPDEWIVFGTPEAGAPQAPWVSLGPADARMEGYPSPGDFLGYDSDSSQLFTLHRVTGNAEAVESIPLGSFGGYDPDALQQVPVIAFPRYGAPMTVHAFIDITGRADVDPSLPRVHGPSGSVFAEVAFPSNASQLHATAGADLLRFSNTFGPDGLEVWGCAARPSASFDEVSVGFRSAAPPSFSWATEVADVCQTTASAGVVVTTTTPQITTANDTDTASLAVQTADVAVALDVDRRLVAAGNDLTFTATVTNAGPYAAAGVVVTWSPPTASGLGPQELPVGALAVGATWSQTFTVPTAGLADGANLSASVAASSAAIDCVATNQAATATATVSNLPNGYVTVSAPATARLLEPFTIRVTYGNDSDNDLASADVTALLPPELTLVSGAPSLTGVPIPAGSEASFDLVVRADACDDLAETLAIGATLAAAGDVIAGDNAAAAETTLLPPAGQLTLAVTPDRAEVAPGGLVRWTLAVRNDGLQAVSDAVVTAVAPAGATVVPGSLTHGSVVGGQISAPLAGAIGPGEARSVSFLAHAPATDGATLTGQATVTATGSCPAAADYAPVAVRTPVLLVTKAADREVACADGPITWTIAVSNPGATPLADVVLTDVLPAGVTYVPGSAGGPGATALGGGVLAWGVPSLAPGAGFVATFATTSPASHGASVNNVAHVSVGGLPVGASNTATVAVDCDGGLTLAKGWDGDCQAPGGMATVALTLTNTSPAPATGAVLVDLVPAGLAPRLPIPNATWDAGARTLTFALGAVPPGASAVAYEVDVLGDAPQGELLVPGASVTATVNGDPGAVAVSGGVSGLILLCDDGDACTLDACEPGVGCVAPPAPDGVACDASDPCTVDGACLAGACVGVAKDCGAIDACHLDGVCDPETGVCSTPAAPDETACDDGVACTADDRCVSGVCVGSDACGADAGLCDVDGFCDPEVGSCEFADAACVAERYYALVVDAGGGLVGAIRCEVGATVVCDENPDGTLRVHADVLTCEP